MEIPVEVIKHIYLHDETMGEGYFFSNTLETICDYSKLFQDILFLSRNNFYLRRKLDELHRVDKKRLSEIELEGYIKGFLTCMKIMNDNKLRLSSDNEKAQ